MAISTPCQTPGAIFSTAIKADKISIQVKNLPLESLDKKQAEQLDANIHNALELVLSPYFKK